ncbi:hypothetical protein Tsubulata_009910 [Turnera subulata]|uniref:Donson n=1 Tax=Turnera subulata TaxID=218843 RepID=A0A9Q0JET8_9ROSI|nr:hypothetical protein Tsubulata_009910 [Turnera subulata]
MAKVAAAPSSTSFQIGGGGVAGGAAGLKVVAPNPMIKRKTPSELRGEQLRRRNGKEVVDESLVPPLSASNNDSELDNGVKKSDPQRNPRYIETRVDEVYPVKKSRFAMLSAKENTKLENITTEHSHSIRNLTVLSNLAAKKKQHMRPENSFSSAEASKNETMQARQTLEKCTQSSFRTVAQLSSGGERSSGSSVVDMDKALKGLVADVPATTADLAVNASEKFSNHASTPSGNFCSECHIPGQKAPLDFTLKTKMRVGSSSSANWLQRSIMCSTYNGVPQFLSKSGCPGDIHTLRQATTSQVLSSEALHSWIYPQSMLPPSVISVLASSAADGVCTSHFVVLFTSNSDSGEAKHVCNAYMSRSTRDLRSLLREHDMCFSMPLCHSKVEQVATEDLIELSEIEKQNLGQTRRRSSFSDVDNSPQSLLAFCGNKNVHGLYDFLLNYRSCLTFLSGVDVPVLYSPVPFQNAALSAPEIRCYEIKRADHAAASPKESTTGDGESVQNLSTGLCSSIEIKDAYIPSWIVSRVCSLMASEGRDFEASFTTEGTSIGLNVALGTACPKSSSDKVGGEGLHENGSTAFGISEAVLTPCLSSGLLKGLKYHDGSYRASLCPV